MKKFFSIFVAVALVAVSFSSCKEKNKPEPVENPKLTIAVSEIEPAAALISVTPENDTLPYYWTYFEAEALEGYTDKQIIDTFLLGEMEFIAWYYDLENYEELLSVGADEYKYESLFPMTDYVALATYVDAEGNVTYGDLFKKAFKTPDVELVSEVNLTGIAGTSIEDYRDYDGSYVLYIGDAVEPEDVEIALNIFDEDFDGEFTEEDLDLDYSSFWISDLEDETEAIYKASFTATLSDDGKKSVYKGWILTVTGMKYHFDAEVDLETLLNADSGAPARKLAAKNLSVKKTAFHKNAKELRLRK